MSDKLRNVLSVLMALVFVFSALALAGRLRDGRKTVQANETAQALADAGTEPPLSAIPEEPIPLDPAPTEPSAAWAPIREEDGFLFEKDLGALRQVSPCVLGWIYIPGSGIDYPLMAFDDNLTGLDQAWDGTKNSAGSIFLECRNRRDFSDFNTLIYGHNIRGGLMFGPLKRYAEQAYLDAHRLVYIVTEDAVRRYEVFAAYEAGVTSDTYRLYFKDDERKQTALDDYVAAAAVGTGVTPSPDDRILTLSTCTGTGTYDTRWVVQAVLTGEFSR